MKVYRLETVQTFPISMDEAWQFFSDPANLQEITPAWLGFYILTTSPLVMYAGMIIQYQLRFYGLIPLRWTTEITHVSPYQPEGPNYFVDEQRFGPYAFWHHEHHFKTIPGGVEVSDIIHYALPLGWLGQLVRLLVVQFQIQEIFDYRFAVLEKKLGRM